jgi:hypothetical protein
MGQTPKDSVFSEFTSGFKFRNTSFSSKAVQSPTNIYPQSYSWLLMFLLAHAIKLQDNVDSKLLEALFRE